MGDLLNSHPRDHVDKVARRHDAVFFKFRGCCQTEVSDHRVRQVSMSLDGGRLLQCYFVWDMAYVKEKKY